MVHSYPRFDDPTPHSYPPPSESLRAQAVPLRSRVVSRWCGRGRGRLEAGSPRSAEPITSGRGRKATGMTKTPYRQDYTSRHTDLQAHKRLTETHKSRHDRAIEPVNEQTTAINREYSDSIQTTDHLTDPTKIPQAQRSPSNTPPLPPPISWPPPAP